MLDEGKAPREAAIQTLREVAGPVIATTLVLLAVFVPVAFLPGITGQLYREFAIAISATGLISTLNALTLSPALCALLLRPAGTLNALARAVNGVQNGLRSGYVSLAGRFARMSIIGIFAAAAAFGGAFYAYQTLPSSLVPSEDQGAFLVDVQLPRAASLARTQEVIEEMRDLIAEEETVVDIITVAGFSLLNGTTGSNTGLIIATMTSWDARGGAGQDLQSVLRRVTGKLNGTPQATAFAFAPPAIPGIGATGGFDYRLQATGGQDAVELAQVLGGFVDAANGAPEIGQAFSTFSASTLQLYLDLDRDRAESFGLPVSEVFSALGAQFGSIYVNGFTYLSRSFQVNIQADAPCRNAVADLENFNRPGPGGILFIPALYVAMQSARS